MHVELFAQSDAGRDAVRGILGDLRRDLQSQGVQSTVDLSSQNQPQQQAQSQAMFGDRGQNNQSNQAGRAATDETARPADSQGEDTSTAAPRAQTHSTSSIDVMA